MKKNIVICLLFTLVLPFKIFGINIDSMLARKINAARPYLIINITSTDCINCRMGSIKILNKLKGSDYKDKIILLSDDRNMASYFQDNADKYDGYKKVYDRDLSRALSLGPSCTASLVSPSGIHSYLFNNLYDDTLNYFKSVLDSNVPETARGEKITDSVISDVSKLYFGNDNAFILNYPFQIGLRYDMVTHSVEYLKPAISDKLLAGLYERIASIMGRKLCDVKTAHKVLHMVGTPIVMAEQLNTQDSSAIFKLYNITLDTTYKGTDTMINANSRMQILLASGMTGTTDVLNLDSYSSYVFFDSVHYLHNTYWPHTTLNYEVFNGHFYVTYCDQEHSRKTNDHGREVTIPTALSIIDFTAGADGKAHAQHVYTVDGYDGASSSDFFFRIDDKGYPVTVNMATKEFTFLKENKKIDFSKFGCSQDETLSSIYDFTISGDTIMFVGLGNKNTCVKGTYDINMKQSVITMPGSNTIYQAMRINGNNILGCKKDADKDELVFDRFTF